ncbi:MAG TPA: hypothetical protein VK816_06400 [Jatrophihabitantaceae bacterium]|jgi:hypothetical protein|nr:hypothetical protein [Jatrophihabitantaceae bacterium]
MTNWDGNDMLPAGDIVDQFATGYLRTWVIRPDPDDNDQVRGYLWVRKPGAERTKPQHAPLTAPCTIVNALHTGGTRLVLPEPAAGGCRYRVDGTSTAARAICEPDLPAHSRAIAATLREVGILVRGIEDVDTGELGNEHGPVLPPGAQRLLNWLPAGAGPRASAAAHAALVTRLGKRRLGTSQEWCESLGRAGIHRDTGRLVLSHGAASLGSVILPDPAGQSCLLIGEDLMLGRRGVDIGFLLGELHELAVNADRYRGEQPTRDVLRTAHQQLRAALLDGYGSVHDPGLVARAGTVRILVHLHDFAAYVGWHPDLLRLADLITELLDDGGRQLLPDAPER